VRLKEIAAGDLKEDRDHPTILYELLKSDLPPQEKSLDRLNEEAQLLVAAGLTTTAWTMTVTSFYVIQNPEIASKLHQELVAVLPDKDHPFSWQDVETLPYLNACIREGLRLAYGLTTRSPRRWPKPLEYNGWTIPARTPVSLSVIDHSHNEDIFPDSHSFRPERWLDGRLDKYFYSFGKGSRSCLGIK